MALADVHGMARPMTTPATASDRLPKKPLVFLRREHAESAVPFVIIQRRHVAGQPLIEPIRDRVWLIVVDDIGAMLIGEEPGQLIVRRAMHQNRNAAHEVIQALCRKRVLKRLGRHRRGIMECQRQIEQVATGQLRQKLLVVRFEADLHAIAGDAAAVQLLARSIGPNL